MSERLDGDGGGSQEVAGRTLRPRGFLLSAKLKGRRKGWPYFVMPNCTGRA
jgi:hypothetical protein